MKLFDYVQIGELALPDATAITLSPESWAILQLAITYAIDPDLWEVDTSDVNALDALLSGAVAELMDIGSGGESMGAFPVVIPATALYFFDACGPSRLLYYPLAYLTQRQATDLVNEEIKVCRWEICCEPGTYVVEMIHDKGSAYGKFWVVSSRAMYTVPLTDCYSSTYIQNAVATGEFTVTEPMKVWFELMKTYKNPASSGGRVAFSAVITRLKHGEE